MPGLKRKRTTRRRQVNTMRRYMRRRPRINRSVNIGRNPIKYSKEQAVGTMAILSGQTANYWAYAPTLDSLTNYAELTQLFDQYRLKTCVFKFRLIYPPEANNTPASIQYYPDIAVTVDHDDATAPSNYDTLLQYGKCKQGILKPNTWFKYKCHPTAAMMLYRTSTTTAYGPASKKQWFDCNNIDIPFYGVKAGVTFNAIGTLGANAYVEIRMWSLWEFKNSR